MIATAQRRSISMADREQTAGLYCTQAQQTITFVLTKEGNKELLNGEQREKAWKTSPIGLIAVSSPKDEGKPRNYKKT